MATMKQAQITTWNTTPNYVEVPVPPTPANAPFVRVKVLASGLHSLVRLRATGTHYSATQLPHVPGSDGVGSLPDGSIVYFSAMMLPHGGAFTEYVDIPHIACTKLPTGADPVQVAGLVNPAAGSWMALASLVAQLPTKFTVTILGVTSLSGTAAVSVAKLFGAGRVVGVARSKDKMDAIDGLDATVVLSDEGSTDWSAALETDVILDFLYGWPALCLLKAVKGVVHVQYMQIGSLAGPTIALPGDLLRSKNITLRGSGPGAWTREQFAQQAPKIVAAVAQGKIKPYPFRQVKLEEVETVWEESAKTGERIVFL
ncbi:hypothetical protein B0H66DRAFT_97745 [Apodospora peruviana]|uniref:Quinone oxidoreductase n=1 Tax=Apodospora peruviana TaxID=516989 RepID=A0AAE0MG99_9PEZI|nr:hypothetical protein B0H66DRAFT_97745 [Apodospora peruviana]